MAREQDKGGRKGRSTSPRSKSGDAKKKSGWVKPDGTPLRKRKGDYFPDQEINKRKPAQRSKSGYPGSSSDAPRPDKRDFKNRDERDDSRSGYTKGPERSDRNEKPGDRTTSPGRADRNDSRGGYASRPEREGRPERSKRDDSKPDYKPRDERSERGDKPERGARPGRAGRDAARSQYRGRPDIAPRSDRTDREDSRSRNPEETSSREGRTDKPVREGSYAAYKARSSRDDRPERPARNADETARPARDESRPAFKKKPFEKKREKYSDRDHSKQMRGRFDTKSGDKAPKRRESYKKKQADGESESAAPGAVRLNKYIANAGICSRREADDLITAGVISVNGVVVTELGIKVNPGDEVKFNDQTLKTETMVYVLLNKPKDYITTTDDPEERKTVMNLVHDAGKERIFPVGRLDRNTTGLLLLTNDGELTKRLTHPSSNVKKIYQVELDNNLTQEDMVRAAEGIELEDGPASVDEIHYESPTEKNVIGVELHSGRNRVVRRIFEAMEYKVRKLDRVYFAGLTKKDLPRGRWRYLTEMEVNMLKMLTGKKK
ncbi:MAG: pseudouridine synthase [Bacteroidota bacterium]|nr:pseudouridine synthase [Bacteroidota bacterium]